jgi:hypothetical protein
MASTTKTRREAAEPSDPPPPPASASKPPSPWHPGPLSGSRFAQRGSWIHPSGAALELAFEGWRLVPDAMAFARLRGEAQAALDEQDRRAVADAVAAVAGDPALQAAEEVVKRLPREVERLEATADEWMARAKRLRVTPGTSAAQIAEAEAAVNAAEADRELAVEQLTRARADLDGLRAQRRRAVEAAATKAVNDNHASLQAERERLLAAILSTVSPMLTSLADVELKLMAASNREQWALPFAAEALQAAGISLDLTPPPAAPAPPPVQPIFARAHATQSATVPAPGEDEGRTFSPAGAMLRG